MDISSKYTQIYHLEIQRHVWTYQANTPKYITLKYKDMYGTDQPNTPKYITLKLQRHVWTYQANTPKLYHLEIQRHVWTYQANTPKYITLKYKDMYGHIKQIHPNISP